MISNHSFNLCLLSTHIWRMRTVVLRSPAWETWNVTPWQQINLKLCKIKEFSSFFNPTLGMSGFDRGESWQLTRISRSCTPRHRRSRECNNRELTTSIIYNGKISRLNLFEICYWNYSFNDGSVGLVSEDPSIAPISKQPRRTNLRSPHNAMIRPQKHGSCLLTLPGLQIPHRCTFKIDHVPVIPIARSHLFRGQLRVGWVMIPGWRMVPDAQDDCSMDYPRLGGWNFRRLLRIAGR
jgi:hypothetical protein